MSTTVPVVQLDLRETEEIIKEQLKYCAAFVASKGELSDPSPGLECAMRAKAYADLVLVSATSDTDRVLFRELRDKARDAIHLFWYTFKLLPKLTQREMPSANLPGLQVLEQPEEPQQAKIGVASNGRSALQVGDKRPNASIAKHNGNAGSMGDEIRRAAADNGVPRKMAEQARASTSTSNTPAAHQKPTQTEPPKRPKPTLPHTEEEKVEARAWLSKQQPPISKRDMEEWGYSRTNPWSYAQLQALRYPAKNKTDQPK